MKVIFLNTWRSKLRDELRAYIQQHINDTAVFSFQEAIGDDRLAYEDLFEGSFTAYAAKKEYAMNGIFKGQNLIYVRNSIAVIKAGSLLERDNDGLNLGVAAYVTLRVGDEELTVCNVHGNPYPGTKLDTPDRLYQTSALIKAFNGKRNVIIGGDFNLLPETKSVQLFSDNGYNNLISDYEIETTRNRISFEAYPDSIQLFADYAFTSAGIAVKRFTVPSTIVSDHQPLELEFDVLQSTHHRPDVSDAIVITKPALQEADE